MFAAFIMIAVNCGRIVRLMHRCRIRDIITRASPPILPWAADRTEPHRSQLQGGRAEPHLARGHHIHQPEYISPIQMEQKAA
jgi:hypothetical protein